MPRRKTHPLVRAICWISLAISLILASGYLFHTSHWPVVLGKYSLIYAIGLVVWFAIVGLSSYFVPRFLLTTSEIKLRRGNVLVGPRHKITAALLMLLTGYVAFDVIVSRIYSGQVATRNPNQFHPYLQNVSRPGHERLHINRWGFRGDDIEKQKTKGVLRVFCLGGSTMYCSTVKYEESHCRVLERELEKHFGEDRVEVQNLGCEWHCSEHSLIKLLTDVPDFDPDVIFVMHGINDLVRSWSPEMFSQGPFRRDYGHYLGATSNLVKPGETFSGFSTAIHGHWLSDFRFQQVRTDGPYGEGLNGTGTMFFPRAKTIEYDDWKSQPVFDRNMREIIRAAKARGIEVVIATQPSLYKDDLSEFEQKTLIFPLSHQFDGTQASIASMAEGMRRFNDVTQRLAQEEEVTLVDLERIVPKDLKHIYDDVHYTPKGNELVGKSVARAIIERETASSDGGP